MAIDWVRCNWKVVFFGPQGAIDYVQDQRMRHCMHTRRAPGQQGTRSPSVRTGELIAPSRRQCTPRANLVEHALAPLVIGEPLHDHYAGVEQRGADVSRRCLRGASRNRRRGHPVDSRDADSSGIRC